MEKINNEWTNDYLFDTVFTAPAGTHHREARRWQLMLFQVPTYESPLQSLGIVINILTDIRRTQEVRCIGSQSVPEHEDVDQGVLLAAPGFCNLVREDVGNVKLCLRVQGNQLLSLPRPVQLDDAEHPVQPVPSRSLEDILRSQTLTTRDKLVVAYILARSVWQYYNTDWLSALWTTGNIHFMMEERDDDRPEKLEFNPALPYFAFASHGYNADSISESITDRVNHRYPRILALGVILVELCRERPLRRTHRNNTLAAIVNNSLLLSLRTISNDAYWPHLDLNAAYRIDFKKAVSVCFDHEKLDHISNSSENPAQKRRDLLWSEVVSPLHNICRILRLIDGAGNVIHRSSHTFTNESLALDEGIKDKALPLSSQSTRSEGFSSTTFKY